MSEETKCALCGKSADFFVEIIEARPDYKYKACPRCKSCLKKLLGIQNEENLNITKLK